MLATYGRYVNFQETHDMHEGVPLALLAVSSTARKSAGRRELSNMTRIPTSDIVASWYEQMSSLRVLGSCCPSQATRTIWRALTARGSNTMRIIYSLLWSLWYGG